jgi:hypothetical protein
MPRRVSTRGDTVSQDLLALLELTRPELTPAEREAIVAATPDAVANPATARASQKPARSRSGSRARTVASTARRRSWAFCGLLPPQLAARFSLAEVAVLSVVAAEVKKRKACNLTVGHLAAVAGVSETTVRNAIREARALALVTVEEKRRTAWMSYPNTIRIVSDAWALWLRLNGCKSAKATPRDYRKEEKARPVSNALRGFRKAGAADKPYQAGQVSGWRQRKGPGAVTSAVTRALE